MDPVVHILLRLLLSAVLLSALVVKARDYAGFHEVVAHYEILPRALTGLACAVVLTWEVAAVAMLWAWPPVGAALAALLFAIYATAITANLIRGRTHIDCGCEWRGGRGSAASRAGLTPWLPLRNVGLVVVAMAIAGPASTRPLSIVDHVLIALAAPFFAGAFLVLDRAVRQWLALRPLVAAAGRSTDV